MGIKKYTKLFKKNKPSAKETLNQHSCKDSIKKSNHEENEVKQLKEAILNKLKKSEGAYKAAKILENMLIGKNK